LIWLGIFVLATVWAPVTEELMFRGMLLGHLRERWGWWISAPVVGLVFALIHPQGWAAVPVLTSLAVVFAGIREWRGSVIGCITAHGVHNGVALLVATAIYA
jgi:membrane protease YdiL (CAAX protease family)